MDQRSRKSRPIYDATSHPLIPRHVKLRFDTTRDRWVILAPERVLVPDDIAVEVLQLCDGQRRIQDVVDILAAKYTADPDLILTDCLALLQDLANKGYLLAASELQP